MSPRPSPLLSLRLCLPHLPHFEVYIGDGVQRRCSVDISSDRLRSGRDEEPPPATPPPFGPPPRKLETCDGGSHPLLSYDFCSVAALAVIDRRTAALLWLLKCFVAVLLVWLEVVAGLLLQGWCVQSSDPRTLGMNSVPKEVIPGQVNFAQFTLCVKNSHQCVSICFVCLLFLCFPIIVEKFQLLNCDPVPPVGHRHFWHCVRSSHQSVKSVFNSRTQAEPPACLNWINLFITFHQCAGRVNIISHCRKVAFARRLHEALCGLVRFVCSKTQTRETKVICAAWQQTAKDCLSKNTKDTLTKGLIPRVFDEALGALVCVFTILSTPPLLLFFVCVEHKLRWKLAKCQRDISRLLDADSSLVTTACRHETQW